MSPLVFGLVAVAAVMHVAWNVLLKTAGDPLQTSARATTASLFIALPLAAAGWLLIGRPAVSWVAVGLACLSGLAEALYFVFLSGAYRRGDLSLVYPIARGTGPLLAVVSGVVILGERLGPEGIAGVVALLAGILAIRRPWGAIGSLLPTGRTVRQRARSWEEARAREAVILALATGAMIAVYSSIDRVGARLTEPWIYSTIIWVATAVGLWGWLWGARRLRGGAGTAGPGEDVDRAAATHPDGVAVRDTSEVPAGGWARSAAIGVLSLLAYLLILVAFRLAPLTAVAPLRESAVVLASGWGAIRLGEARGRQEAVLRLAGAGLIVVGAVLLALD